MEMMRGTPPVDVQESAAQLPADALAVPPFPVLLRVPNFSPQGADASTPVMKTISMAKQKPRRPRNPESTIRLAWAAVVVLIVAGIAALVHQRPEWFAPKLDREQKVEEVEELVLPIIEPSATQSGLSEVQDIEVPETAPPRAAQLEMQIVPVDKGESP